MKFKYKGSELKEPLIKKLEYIELCSKKFGFEVKKIFRIYDGFFWYTLDKHLKSDLSFKHWNEHKDKDSTNLLDWEEFKSLCKLKKMGDVVDKRYLFGHVLLVMDKIPE